MNKFIFFFLFVSVQIAVTNDFDNWLFDYYKNELDAEISVKNDRGREIFNYTAKLNGELLDNHKEFKVVGEWFPPDKKEALISQVVYKKVNEKTFKAVGKAGRGESVEMFITIIDDNRCVEKISLSSGVEIVSLFEMKKDKKLVSTSKITSSTGNTFSRVIVRSIK